MADLTGQQLKNSYQNLVTIDATIESNPTSGQLENGLGNPITALGIGTDSPTRTLQVHEGSATSSGIKISNSTTGATIDDGFDLVVDSVGNAYMAQKEALPLIFLTSDTERMRITSGGDISFYEDTGSTPKLVWDASDERLNLSGSDYQFGIQQGANQPWYHRGVSDGSYRLHLNGTGDIITLDSSGNVGIGVSPRVALDVAGEVAIAYNATYGLRFYNEEQNNWSSIGNNVATGSSSANLVFKDSTGEVMRIDGGNVGIGVSPAQTLNVVNNGAYQFRLGTPNSASVYWEMGRDNVSTGDFLISNGTERMRIDSSGNVGIGETDPDSKLHLKSASAELLELERTSVGAYRLAISASDAFSIYDVGQDSDRLTIDSSGNVGINCVPSATTFEVSSGNANNIAHFKSTDSVGYIAISDNTTSPALGNYIASQGNEMFFATADTERMRITSDGYVGIGTGDTDVQSGDLIGVLAFNSKDISTNSSGAIGSIRSYATAAFNTGAVSGDLRFYTQNNGAPNGSLLSGTERMRILSGGGITFNGDTAQANALDDYEEGTFDFGITFGGGSTAITYAIRQGQYTKIGRQVTVNGQIELSNKGTDTGIAKITGLPFTVGTGSDYYSGVSIGFINNISFADQMVAYTVVSSTTIQLANTTNAGAHSLLDDTDFSNNSSIIINLTYFV